MRVKYKVQNVKERSKQNISPNEKIYYKRWNILPDKFRLTFNSVYTVMGIEFTKEGYVNLMIVDDTNVSFPDFFPIEFFDVIDYRISKYWGGNLGAYYPIRVKNCPNLITFNEFLIDDFFFDKLLDGDTATCNLFNRYKLLIDNEYPDTNIKEAIIVDNEWVMCNYCEEVWKVDAKQGVVICPLNFERNNNPLWMGIPPIEGSVSD